MKKLLLNTVLVFALAAVVNAQKPATDTAALGTVTTVKDPRIEAFGKKLADYNDLLATSARAAKGYRLMLLSTSDRNMAMQVRSQLLKQFPEQKVYMAFQTPYIKLKFGNFSEREEAERFRKQISAQKIVTGNIYIVPEMIELRPDKLPKDD